MPQNIWNFPNPILKYYYALGCPIHFPFIQMPHSFECSIPLNDPFTWKPLSADPFKQMTHSFDWPIHLNDPFTWKPFQQTCSVEWFNDPSSWMTHSLKWPICLNDSFTWKPLSTDQFTWITNLLECPIHKWPICLNDQFTWRAHSLESLFQQNHSLEWPFTQMTYSTFTQMIYLLEWPIHSHDLFNWMTHSLESPFQQAHSLEWPIHLNDPFTWMTHSIEWPICVQRWNVCPPLLSKQYYLKLWSFRCYNICKEACQNHQCFKLAYKAIVSTNGCFNSIPASIPIFWCGKSSWNSLGAYSLL